MPDTLKDFELRLKQQHKELDKLEEAAYGITLPNLFRLMLGEKEKSRVTVITDEGRSER